ncbi:MAG: hypothetical protein HY473_00970 [Candidatus Sungbacteria bacterium]|uniref:Uncharacterized protein n=1 Tax=Candidatus Sungiibacteriota bacterium TaxID=2750080 RepID=A0A933DTH0_9BACT|nr:hypothetical protein [Candidatus Sungbacteria bacterium]
MITIQILGTSSDSTEEQLQAITKDLHDLCRAAGVNQYYVAFPADRMQMDLGVEIVALVSGGVSEAFGLEIGRILEEHFPVETLIGVQVIEARTARELTKKS